LHHKNIDAELLGYQKRYRDGKSVPFIVAAERDTYNGTHVPAHVVFRTKKGWIKEFTILSLRPSREGDANRASVEVVYYIFGIPLIKEFTVQQLMQRGIERFGYAFERAY